MQYKVMNTAYGVAKIRACERFYPAEKRVIDDPYSYPLLPASTRFTMWPIQWPRIRDFFMEATDRLMPGVMGLLLCRTRYIDEVVVQTVTEKRESAFGAVVNLGAGLDTRALRIRELSEVPYYEVDYPEIVGFKREKFTSILGELPRQLHFVLIDFNKQDVSEELSRAGCPVDKKKLFIWEGVTQYISEDAFSSTLEFVSKSPHGSRLVFTYVLKDFLDGSRDYGGIGRLQRLGRRFGVSLQNGINPQELPDILAGYGMKLVEDVGHKEHVDRYLAPVSRSLRVGEVERVALAEVGSGQ